MDTETVVLSVIAMVPALLIAVVVCMRFPWLSLALFWVLPNVKLWLRVYVPVTHALDPTALTGILVVLVMAARLLMQRRQRGPIDKPLLGLHVGLALVMALSLLWTTAPNYGSYKVLRFAVFSTIALAGPMVLLNTPTQAKRMGQVLVLLSLLVAASMLAYPTYQIGHERAQWELRQTAFGASPLNPAFVMAVGAVLALTGLRESGMFFRVLSIGAFPVILTAVYRTGSRAMFAQVFLGLAIWVLLTRSKLRWVYRLLLVGVFLTIPAALAVLGRGGHAEERVKTAMEAPVETVLSSGRLRYWAFVLRGAPGRPVFGHGAGSFAVDAKNDDARHFPHNLFLEALYEEGGVGLLLLVGFVAVPFYRYVSWRRLSRPLGREPPVINTWFAVATSGFLAVLLHWDLADIRLVWFLFGVLTVQCLVQQQAAQRQELAPPYTTGPTDTRLALEDGGVGRPQRPRGTGPL